MLSVPPRCFCSQRAVVVDEELAHANSQALNFWITLPCREVGLVAHDLSRSVTTAVPTTAVPRA